MTIYSNQQPSTDDNFLGALPEDLRIEIENDMKRQRDELLRVSVSLNE